MKILFSALREGTRHQTGLSNVLTWIRRTVSSRIIDAEATVTGRYAQVPDRKKDEATAALKRHFDELQKHMDNDTADKAVILNYLKEMGRFLSRKAF